MWGLDIVAVIAEFIPEHETLKNLLQAYKVDGNHARPIKFAFIRSALMDNNFCRSGLLPKIDECMIDDIFDDLNRLATMNSHNLIWLLGYPHNRHKPKTIADVLVVGLSGDNPGWYEYYRELVEEPYVDGYFEDEKLYWKLCETEVD